MSAAITAVVVGGLISRNAQKKKNAREDAELARIQAEEDAMTDLYGDLEKNLAEYYTNLTPELLTATGLQDEAEAFAKTKEQITTRIAQRGIGGGGLEAELISEQAIGSAERRAEIRATAEETTRERQRAFLQGGKQEKREVTRRADVIRARQSESARLEEQAAQQTATQLIGTGAKAFGKQDVDTDFDPEIDAGD